MRLKSCIKTVAALLVLCMCTGLAVFGEGVQTHIYGEKNIVANVGETFEFPVYIENNPGIYRFTISITYDKNVIEPVADSEKNGTVAPSVLANPSYMNKADTRVAAMSYDNFSGDGVLFTYTFKVKSTQKEQTEMKVSVVDNSVKRIEKDLSLQTITCVTDSTVVNISGQAEPTVEPTAEPTAEPTVEPATEPTAQPTTEPTAQPTTEPTAQPATTSSVSFKENVFDIKYMAPVSDKIFEPDRAATRYEVVEALYELLDFNGHTEKEDAFSDVDDNYKAIVNAFAQTPIISGYPDGTFGGENKITRAEFVKVMATAAGITEDASIESKFSDVNGHWAQGYIAAFVDAGYILGYPDNTFLPEAYVKRAEVVAIINRVIGKKATADSASVFDDLSNDHWAFGDIMSAVK